MAETGEPKDVVNDVNFDGTNYQILPDVDKKKDLIELGDGFRASFHPVERKKFGCYGHNKKAVISVPISPGTLYLHMVLFNPGDKTKTPHFLLTFNSEKNVWELHPQFISEVAGFDSDIIDRALAYANKLRKPNIIDRSLSRLSGIFNDLLTAVRPSS